MHDVPAHDPVADGADKNERYLALRRAIDRLTADEDDGLANFANAAAAINEHLPGVNWVGFYLLRGSELTWSI